MTTLGPKPKRIDLYITKNITWSKVLMVKDATGAYIDLTGHTFTGKIRKTPTSVASSSFTFTLLTSTTVAWELPDTVSAALTTGCNDADPASKYVYDVLWTRPSEDPVCLLKGIVTINPRIT